MFFALAIIKIYVIIQKAAKKETSFLGEVAVMKKKPARVQSLLPLILSLIAFLAVLAGILYLVFHSVLPGKEPTSSQTESVQILPLNTRDADDFVKTNERISYPGAVAGIDVSAHQQGIDWELVKSDGIDFAIIRAGYRGCSEGGLYEDECFQANIQGALSAGLQVGVYFFSQAVSVEEAVEEAEYTLQLIRDYDVSLPVFFDWEENASGRTGGILLQDVSDFAAAFCMEITSAGFRGGVYFNQTYGYSFRLEELRQYDFWLAEYRDNLSFYYDVDWWQYTHTGNVAGIDLDVDLNLMFPHED